MEAGGEVLGEHHGHARLALRRGDIAVCIAPGDYGKPRPSVIVQANRFNDGLGSVVVCPLTSDLVESSLLRLPVIPSEANGIRKPSVIMIDKIAAVRRDRIKSVTGHLDRQSLNRLDELLQLLVELRPK